MADKYRDFNYRGIRFHLNDNGTPNNPRHEYEGKYWLMWWNEPCSRWQSIITVNNKAEALRAVREFYKTKTKCYAY